MTATIRWSDADRQPHTRTIADDREATLLIEQFETNAPDCELGIEWSNDSDLTDGQNRGLMAI